MHTIVIDQEKSHLLKNRLLAIKINKTIKKQWDGQNSKFYIINKIKSIHRTAYITVCSAFYYFANCIRFEARNIKIGDIWK